ncbi:acyltransferase family protein [Flavobacterium terrae]|uniref:Peptidoglycan/LPS O-acetylase OafA/YrhL, contains acyltransferase and SGNH-hydrolase domains n=1 Tax=Flavobacterium terrae TaxID=415425 RepID=A0A1M6FR97_9FLAO|nr:acyltransferase [Flavobacterium terrae]SHJ00248.1 Peptidoglycan/LPS O-acetylase OafA/YrhL, contains acyltransferase and SGNH-hydrolase domains [Flavobacterium terrae]
MNQNATNNRIPSLDGLRAISILMVVFGHAFHIGNLNIANLGVRIFFVISAYLIVGILLRDVDKGQFSIKTFYFKRFSRTFPAFYFYLLIVYVVLQFLDLFEWEQFWRAPVYLENYHPRSLWNDKQWFVGHTWSLAVEEQFYVLIALLFLFLNKKILSKRHLILVFISIVLLVPLIRVSYLYFTFIPDILAGSIHRSFETVADSLAIGGIMAIFPSQKIKASKYFLYFKNKIAGLILIILLCQLMNSSFVVSLLGLKIRYLYNLIGLTVINSCIGLILLLSIHFPSDSFFTRFLNCRFMVVIGLWSYSIYLWQQIWLYSWDFPLIFKFIGILICSVISYYCIETKFLAWRDTFLKRNENI